MTLQTAKTEKVCPQDEIAAYIDGELSSREELDLEIHFAGCAGCRSKLNEQKKMLCALDFALEADNLIELPVNFTKVVIANAESNVSGLRQPQERFKALFICASLFLVVIIGLGSETETVIKTFGKFGEQTFAVGSFAFHLIYDFAVGISIILRSISHQIVFNSAVAEGVLVIFFITALFALSRLVVRYDRP